MSLSLPLGWLLNKLFSVRPSHHQHQFHTLTFQLSMCVPCELVVQVCVCERDPKLIDYPKLIAVKIKVCVNCWDGLRCVCVCVVFRDCAMCSQAREVCRSEQRECQECQCNSNSLLPLEATTTWAYFIPEDWVEMLICLCVWVCVAVCQCTSIMAVYKEP